MRSNTRSFRHNGFEKSGMWKAGVSALALAATAGFGPLAGVAHAQDNDEAAAEEGDDVIVVTGFLESLRTSQSIKRNSSVIVDSVSAEDIGALPDRSVTETLQRIPGIAITRFAAPVDPDHFSVEGSGVVVRGLTYVRSEFNGREAFTANNGRALGFSDVPSELLGGVDVFKSPSASMVEGGIAGIVNLRTRKPFDSNDMVLSASAELNYADFIDKASPTVSGLFSNVWETGIGEIGLLASASYSQVFSQADRFQLSSFRTRPSYSDGTRTDVVNFTGATQGPDVIFPRGAVAGRQRFDRERYGYAASAQWRSTDGRMEATAEFLRSDARQAWTENTVEIATDNVESNGDSRAVTGTSLNFGSSGLFESGFITGPTGWRSDQNGGAARTPINGLQSNNIRRDHLEKLVTSDYSFNFKWEATDRLAINIDYQHVDSFSDIVDNGLWTTSYQDVYMELSGNDLPVVQFLPPENCPGGCTAAPGTSGSPAYYTGDHQSFLDPFNTSYRSAMDHIEYSDGNMDTGRIDLSYAFPDSNFLESISAGVRYADRRQTARHSTYNWGVLSEQWGNGGPVWLDEPILQNGNQPLNGYQEYNFDNFFGGRIEDPFNGEGRLFYAGNTAQNYDQYIDYANQIVDTWLNGAAPSGGSGGWRSLAARPGVLPGTVYLPGEVNPQREENTAAYVMAEFNTMLGDTWELSGNIGLRYSNTDRQSDGFRQFASSGFTTDAQCDTQIAEATVSAQTTNAPVTISAFCAVSPADRQEARDFLNGALEPNSASLSYDYWLPNLNLKLDTGGGLQFRAAYFKGVAPPPLGYVRNYYPITLAAVTGLDSAGNSLTPQVNPDGSLSNTDVTFQGTFNAGNPYLLPTTADNFDLTAEYYWGGVGQLTLSMFHKRLKGVQTNSSERLSITNNGATFDQVVTTAVNAPETGKITGFELAYQQVYDFLPGFLSGFGIQGNYTYVKSTGVPQTTLSPTDPDVGAGRASTLAGNSFPLQGLSEHTFNITPFIDIGDFSARASYNWRSRYLSTLRDVITPFDPIFAEAYGQLDASITYSITDQIKIGVQGVNLTNSVTKTSAAVADQSGEALLVPRGWFMNDTRYTFIVRFNY